MPCTGRLIDPIGCVSKVWCAVRWHSGLLRSCPGVLFKELVMCLSFAWGRDSCVVSRRRVHHLLLRLMLSGGLVVVVMMLMLVLMCRLHGLLYPSWDL